MRAVSAPAEVRELADRRAAARAARDFAEADRLRAAVTGFGWRLRDTADGYRLDPAPPFEVAASATDLPDRTSTGTDVGGRTCSIGLVVDGWPSDLRRCVEAVLAHAPAGVVVVGLDLGDVDGAGQVLHDLAAEHPGRVEEWHLEGGPSAVGWGPARAALLRLDPAPVHVVMDSSTVLDGDALTPLLAALDADPGVVAAGWQGALVDVDDGWRSVAPAGPGEVDVLLGYLFAVRRDAALAAPPHAKARFYRNADLEWSLALREAGGRLVVPPGPLPCHQERHRGYHDTDPEVRERESRRTYHRLLQRFRGRTHLLAPRPARSLDPDP